MIDEFIAKNNLIDKELGSIGKRYNFISFLRFISFFASVILLYMGLSDKKWWQAIGKRLMSGDAVLFFFPYDSKKDVIRHENYLRRWTNAYYAELMAKLEIDAEQIPQLRDSVFIGINKTIM